MAVNSNGKRNIGVENNWQRKHTGMAPGWAGKEGSRKGRAHLGPSARTAQLDMHFFRCGLPSQDFGNPGGIGFN